jgi:phosphoglycerate dehydrogenase-like enzyme
MRQPILDALAAIPGVEATEIDADQFRSAATEFDALVISDPRGSEGTTLAEALTSDEARVRWVQLVSAGHSGLLSHDLPNRLLVTNQGGALAPAVAEHALALILAHNRRLPAALNAQRDCRWDKSTVRAGARTLEGAIVAIVGLGHVGRALAARLTPFGAELIGVNRDGSPCAGFHRVEPLDALDAVLSTADVVALCLPDSPATYRLMNSERLARMKPDALLVNVGRGTMVDTDALAAALVAGTIGGAALDVTDPEPLPPDHPLWRAPNLLITPHIAGGGSPLAAGRIAGIVAENALRYVNGEPLLHQVFPVVPA